jgi:hypothetical protein
MAKQKELINVLRTNSDACVSQAPQDGIIGFPWQSGGTTHSTIPLRK